MRIDDVYLSACPVVTSPFDMLFLSLILLIFLRLSSKAVAHTSTLLIPSSDVLLQGSTALFAALKLGSNLAITLRPTSFEK